MKQSLTESQFYDVIPPKIGNLWSGMNGAKGLTSDQWKEWFRGLRQFTEETILEALGRLYREGTKYSWPRLNEVMAVCFKIVGKPEHAGSDEAPKYHDQIRIRHPNLKNNTDKEIDIVMKHADWEAYRKRFGDREQATITAWAMWQRALCKNGELDDWDDKNVVKKYNKAMCIAMAEVAEHETGDE